jgi:3-mercaptopyruvate sulfurtransferase SseA
MLKLVGIENCAVLDGGFKSWLASKFPDKSIPKIIKRKYRIFL